MIDYDMIRKNRVISMGNNPEGGAVRMKTVDAMKRQLCKIRLIAHQYACVFARNRMYIANCFSCILND